MAIELVLPAEEAPTTLRVCAVWARIGLQSFGGGQAVQLYAYRAFVQKRRWLTSAEWADAWGFCQLIPGINLLALAALTGSRLVGTAGALAGVVGLLAPGLDHAFGEDACGRLDNGDAAHAVALGGRPHREADLGRRIGGPQIDDEPSLYDSPTWLIDAADLQFE